MFECVALKSLAHHETGNCNLIPAVGILPSNYTTTANGASTPRYHGGLFLLQPAEDTLKLDLSSQPASETGMDTRHFYHEYGNRCTRLTERFYFYNAISIREALLCSNNLYLKRDTIV